jgi:cell division protein FtsA
MESILNPNPEIVVALNIGSNKVLAMVGRKNILGKMEILGYGKAACEGVTRGVVTNIDKTAKAIDDAIDLAEKKSKHEIQAVFVGIAGDHIKSLHHQGVLYRDDPKKEISQEDIDRLTQDMYKIPLAHGDKILHVIPQEFFVDHKEGCIDPIGMSGSRLESNFHIITANSEALENLMRAVDKAGLQIAGFVLESTATADAVLSKEEKEGGVVLVDLGSGTTEVGIYFDGIVRYTSVIPLGSNVITKDIKSGCSVLMDQAEKLKVRFGSALADEIVDNRVITIPGLMGREPKEISEKNLARIIQSRVEELFEYVMWEIRRSGFENNIMAGMVLTGGGSKLKDIELLAEFQTGLSTRIGEPLEHKISYFDQEYSNPSFATIIGILHEAIQKVTPGLPVEPKETVKTPEIFDIQDDIADTRMMETVELGGQGKSGWFNRVVTKGYDSIKEFFAASPDSEF